MFNLVGQVEALCVELMKAAFRCNYADDLLTVSMLGNMTVHYALTQLGDAIISAPLPVGRYTSNRIDGLCAVSSSSMSHSIRRR